MNKNARINFRFSGSLFSGFNWIRDFLFPDSRKESVSVERYGCRFKYGHFIFFDRDPCNGWFSLDL
ncbi:hypothetical protein LEP1GSC066_3111 [Leptospira sp. serovar Kenya str. Sh9]|nr:hypothetical protein LEP1GSC066_3111 [Leptospira sp. serovar Kenya str. Sh9]